MATQSFAFEELGNAVASIRYLTDKFVTVSSSSASRLANIFDIPQAQICVDRGVELLHSTDLWAWWSDDKLTTAIGLADELRPSCLSKDAVMLIDRVCYSTKGRPSCGWSKLAKIEKILEEECIARGLLEVPERLKKLTVEYIGGKREILYSFACTDVGDKERYFYEVDTELPLDLIKQSTISRLIVSVDEIQRGISTYKIKQVVAA